jgi:prepilin-type N-terminal cleavage/methylation domain-containing protein
MERQKMKRKGFTLVELLVVIAIIAMLLAILMPALGKVRQIAQRIMCATNLSGIGKAMLTYSTDDKYESHPVAGSPGALWSRGTGGYEGQNSFDWRNPKAFPEPAGTPYRVTLSAHLYLLVKFADVSPEQFICPGSDLKKYELSKYNMDTITPPYTGTDMWDFGGNVGSGVGVDKALPPGSRGKGHQSYSFQSPVAFAGTVPAGSQIAFPITTSSSPSTPVMADRNPFWQSPVVTATTTARMYHWDSTATAYQVYTPSIPNGNSTYHQKDGQNVLYADRHSAFAKSANCGIGMDNIYTFWGPTTTSGVIDSATEEFKRQCGMGAPTGAPPTITPASGKLTTSLQLNNANYPVSAEDSYLVSDVDNDTVP